MSELTGADEQPPTTEDTEDADPGGLTRFVPAVVFGLQTAALAGLAVSAGAVAMGLTGVFDDAIAITYTTCSRPH